MILSPVTALALLQFDVPGFVAGHAAPVHNHLFLVGAQHMKLFQVGLRESQKLVRARGIKHHVSGIPGTQGQAH